MACRLRLPGFPGKSTGGPIRGFSQGANFPHGLVDRSPSSLGFPFHPPRRTTPVLLPPLKRRPIRQRSPHHRVTRAFSPKAYTLGLPTAGRRRASPVMSQDHFLQAAACGTRVVRRRHPYHRRREDQVSPALHPRAVAGAPNRPKCCLPESLYLAPSRRFLLRHSRWNRPSCVPPLTVAEFEQRVLNEHGLAQVGFGIRSTSFRQTSPFSHGLCPC